MGEEIFLGLRASIVVFTGDGVARLLRSRSCDEGRSVLVGAAACLAGELFSSFVDSWTSGTNGELGVSSKSSSRLFLEAVLLISKYSFCLRTCTVAGDTALTAELCFGASGVDILTVDEGADCSELNQQSRCILIVNFCASR